MARILDDSHRLIITLIVGMIIGEFLPEPTDPIYFFTQNWLVQNKGLIPEFNWYAIMLFSYYCLSAIWYIILLGFFLLFDIIPHQRMYYFIGLVSLGGVIAIIIEAINNTLTFTTLVLSVFAVVIASFVIIYIINRFAPEDSRIGDWHFT